MVIERVIDAVDPSAIFWNRRYGEAEIALDSAIKKRLIERGIPVQSFSGKLLHEPWEIKNQAGRPFQVFTPYLRALLARPIAKPLPAPSRLQTGIWPSSIRDSRLDLDDLKLEPRDPDWAKGFNSHWRRGEAAAQAKLDDFLEDRLVGYAKNRDLPAIEGTSRLSPHLRFGEISPLQVWHAVQARSGGHETDGQKLLSEVAWRDFSHQLLHDYPHLPDTPHNPRFRRFPWRNDQTGLEAWQRGLTGYPIVDAGMRQLWQTGWMHNRVRMIVASFLVKHLLIDWRHGERWFWDTLVDADAASNAFSWQWIAGSGPDSSPFHRIFNPVSQGEKFDSEGDYVRAYVPELTGLPPSLVHKPWEAPEEVLREAGIRLGETYPTPIVSHAPARERALQAFRELREDEI